MITQSTPSPQMTYYDPLASHFMTGGQMQYMPNAQFLTSAQYGAFRTMPGPQMAPTMMHQPTFLQSWLAASRGAPFGIGPAYTFNTYNPAVDQVRFLTQAGRRTSDQLDAISGGFADVGVSTLAALGAGALFGPFAGVAAGLGMPGVSQQYLDRIRMGRQIQNLTMSKIIAGPDMAAGLGQGFSLSAGVRMGESIRDMAADNLFFNVSDMKSMMRLGIEHGQFDYSLNVSQYKDTMKKLTKNFKAFMEVLETADLGSLAKEMQRLQRMGAGVGAMGGIIQQESMFSRMAGLSHADMVNTYGQQGALIYSQAGLTNYQGSMASMSNAATVTMMQRMGLLNPGEVARAGGASGLVQRMTASKAQTIQNVTDYILPYIANSDFTGIDQERLKEVLSGQTPFDVVMARGGARVKSPGAFSKYRANRASLQEVWNAAAGEAGMDITLFNLARQVGERSGMDDPREAALYGFQTMGMDGETARQLVSSMTDTRVLSGRMNQMQAQAHRAKRNDLEEEAFRKGIFNRAILSGQRGWQHLMASTVGEFTRWRAEQKDYDENMRAGIVTVRAAGTAEIEASSINEQARQLTTEKYGMSGVISYSDRYNALTGWERFAGSEEAIANYKFQEELLGARHLSGKQKLNSYEALAKYNINDMALQRQIYQNLKDKKNPSEQDLRTAVYRALRDSGTPHGQAIKAADEILGNPDARRAILNKVATDQDLGYTMRAVEARVSDHKTRIASNRMEYASELRSELRENIGELAAQGWFGVNDVSGRDAMISAMGTSVEEAAGYAMFETARRQMLNGTPSEAKEIEAAVLEFVQKFGIKATGFDDAVAKFEAKFGGKLSEEQKRQIKQQIAEKISRKKWSAEKMRSYGGRMYKTVQQARDIIGIEGSLKDALGVGGANTQYYSTEEVSGSSGKNADAIQHMQNQTEVLKRLLVTMNLLNEKLGADLRSPVQLPQSSN